MEPREKRAFEPTGLVPRSIVRTFERFRQQLLPGSEVAAIREYRISRYQVLVSARCLCALLTIPIATNWFVSCWLLSPLIKHVWNTQQNEIFLNSYQEERAFAEMEAFSEKLFFESLLVCPSCPHMIENTSSLTSAQDGHTSLSHNDSKLLWTFTPKIPSEVLISPTQKDTVSSSSSELAFHATSDFDEVPSGVTAQELLRRRVDTELQIKQKVQGKILELAQYYNQQTILSITNVAGDFISALTLGFLFIRMKPEITILKSFLVEAIYSLSDTTKSFLLILLTDLLVGFHSPRGWETALELLLKHFGLPENQDFVFLFVATFPVLLDTVFKYWIFRHLNKISPSTVATYHSMIE